MRRLVSNCMAALFVASGLTINGTAHASSIGTPPGGNRAPLNFIAGSPFSISTWTPAQNAHIPGIANGIGLAKHGYGLDLTNSNATMSLLHVLRPHQSVTLDLGSPSNTQVFTRNMTVTPAEFVAILQVITKSSLSLTLGSNGTATGGDFSLNGLLSPRVTQVTIPAGVVALDNIARNPLMGISGDLLNYGTIYAYSTSSRIHTGLIYTGFGGNFTNEAGGLISTFLPTGTLATTVHTLPNINLVLAADNNITNLGTILGSGALKFATAYGIIANNTTNTSTPAIIQAVGNVTLLPGATGTYRSPSAAATVFNTGTITSTSGNIAINSPLALADIYINGMGTATSGSSTVNVTGLFQAYQGSVDVRDVRYRGPANIALNGGDYEATAGFNAYGGFGNIIGDGSLAAASAGGSLQTNPISAGILSTHTLTGTVSLVDQTTTGITVNPSNAGTFALQTAGNTTLNSISTSNGPLSVIASTGTLQTLPGVTLSANNGSLLLQNTDDTNGKIVIGTASNLNTSGISSGAGTNDVVLAVGATIAKSNPINSWNNVVINNQSPGTNAVYSGAAGFTANPGTNVFTVKSADIVFSTSGNATANSITLNGFVDITADPVGYAAHDSEQIVDTLCDAEGI